MEKEILKITVLRWMFLGLGLLVCADGAWAKEKKQPKIVYQKKTDLDFDGMNLEGELKNPAEFYFEHRPQEKFDSLVKRRPNFHREMLRDSVMGR